MGRLQILFILTGQILFIIGKLTHQVNWSWSMILLPIEILICFYCIYIAFIWNPKNNE